MKGPLHNLFVKVSEDLDFVTTLLHCFIFMYFYAGTIADNEQAPLYCTFAPFFRFPRIYGTLQFHFFKRCVSFIDFVHNRYADRYISSLVFLPQFN